MNNSKVIDIKNPELKNKDVLTDILRSSAKEMLACAIETELQEFLANNTHLLTVNNKLRVVRNGYLPERQITIGIGLIDVKMLRARDRSNQEDKINFISSIIPKHLCRSGSIEELLPLLYLKGISTNDFRQALKPILGEKAKNISPRIISKLKSKWEQEYINWNKRDLSNKEYVYIWVYGIYLQARMEAEKRCVLVIIGVIPAGVQAKKMLQDIWMADTKNNALKAYKKFINYYKIKYHKAVECLEKDKDKLLTFYDFPAENWQHIITTNLIESTFATVRHRTYKAKGCFSQITILTMVFKLCIDAQKHWKKLYGFNRLAEVISGIKFVDGVRVRSKNSKINNKSERTA